MADDAGSAPPEEPDSAPAGGSDTPAGRDGAEAGEAAAATDGSDPAAGAPDIDGYEITTWTPRTRLDRLSVWGYRAGAATVRAAVVLLALTILLSQFLLGGLGVSLSEPLVLLLVGLSAVPAVAIAAYIRYGDVSREPLSLIVWTFVLAVLFASFAAVVNTATRSALGVGSGILIVPYFFLIVGPVEETVKLLAVRLGAYRSDSFDAVVDGAVYGAFAGLGFATIENAVYIGQQYLNAAGTGTLPVVSAATTAAGRTLAGPGHVLYSGFAGYYLGLAKFNREWAGPLVVKGLLIAALIHASYNTLVGIVPGLLASATALGQWLATVAFILTFDAIVALALFRKIARYRAAVTATDPADRPPAASEGG
jgi:RsiW-degrading membrane proteinase PrsW (M82 family)